MSKDEVHPRKLQKAYEGINGVVFVPHYRKRGLFVGPGGVIYHTNTLADAGARATRLLLWPRGME